MARSTEIELNPTGSVISIDCGTSSSVFGLPYAEEPPVIHQSPARKACSLTDHHRKCLCGLGLMTVGSACWVGQAMYVRQSLQWKTFRSPSFLFYFSSSWLVVIYPIYLTAKVIACRGNIPLKDTLRDSIKLFINDDLTPAHPHKLLGKFSLFCLLWSIINYVFIRALTLKGCLDVTALFTTMPNFLYLMAWIILQKRFIAIRIVAFLVAMAGIIMITYMDKGFASHEMWGAMLALVATAGAAAYKVMFRKIFGIVTIAELSMFMSCMGVMHICTMWPIWLALYLTGAEPMQFNTVPWHLICPAAALAIVLNMVLNFGPVYTYTLLIQTAFLISIPVAAIAELIWSTDFAVTSMQIAAYVLIAVSFLLNALPENFPETMLKALHCKLPRDATSRHNDAHMTPRQRVLSTTGR